MEVLQAVYVLCHLLTVSVLAFACGRVYPHRTKNTEQNDNAAWSVRSAAAHLMAVWGFSYTFFLPLFMLKLPPEPEAIVNTFLTFTIILVASIVTLWSVNQFLQLKANKRDWLPYVVVPEVVTFVLHLIVSTPETLAIYFGSVVCVMLFGIWYFYRRYNVYKRLIEEEYSNLEGIELRWVQGLCLAMTLQSANFIAVCVFNSLWLEFVGMAIVCISALALEECAFRTRAISIYLIEQAAVADKSMHEADRTPDNIDSDNLEQLAEESHNLAPCVGEVVESVEKQQDTACETVGDEVSENTSEQQDNAIADDDPRQKVYAVIRHKLAIVCENENLFLDPDLTREMLCSAIKVNRTYLSEYLRSEGMTYYNYINGLRIHYAVQLLRSNPELPLLDVSYRSGYSNPATFRRAFREIMGCLPSEYQV